MNIARWLLQQVREAHQTASLLARAPVVASARCCDDGDASDDWEPACASRSFAERDEPEQRHEKMFSDPAWHNGWGAYPDWTCDTSGHLLGTTHE